MGGMLTNTYPPVISGAVAVMASAKIDVLRVEVFVNA
jgi:hypothetical protein